MPNNLQSMPGNLPGGDIEIDRRNWISGLQKGLAIIEAFDSGEGRLTTTEVAQLTQMTRSTARRHLMMLQQLGYVGHDGKSFWLQPKVLRLGTAYLSSARLPRIVQPFLQRLTAVTQENAFVAILDGPDLVYVARNGSNRISSTGFVLGSRISPVVSSAGIALLSSLPPHLCRQIVEGCEVKPYTPFTLSTPAAIHDAIRMAALAGYALVEQQLELGVRGLAVPLKNHRAETIGAISLNMPMEHESTTDALRRVLPALQQVAVELRHLV